MGLIKRLKETNDKFIEKGELPARKKVQHGKGLYIAAFKKSWFKVWCKNLLNSSKKSLWQVVFSPFLLATIISNDQLTNHFPSG